MLNATNSGVINSLRLSDQEATEILSALSHKRAEAPGRNRRVEERIAYTHHAGLIVKVHHRGGTVVNHLVRVRNLSGGGIGFLHGSYLHTGTHCTVILRTRSNTSVCMGGTVARCEHVQKHIHEVGLKFDKPIQMDQFVASALRMETDIQASKELTQLSGTVIYVEDSLSDQELLAFHLGNVGVKVKGVSDGLTAAELIAANQYDAVLANILLPTMSGSELAEFLRQGGYKGPIILLTANGRVEIQKEALQRGCNAVLVKPYSFEQLYALLDPHLRASRKPAKFPTLTSELWGDQRLRPLIRRFLVRLRADVRLIQEYASMHPESAVLRKLCMDAKGSAGGYGFPTISVAAEAMLELLMDRASNERVQAAGMELANLCYAACAILDGSKKDE